MIPMKPMKSVAVAVSVATLLLASVLQAAGTDESVTLKGEIKCAKCALKEADAKECQNILQTEVGGKKVTYVLVDTDASKGFKGKACHEGQKVTVTGTVTEVAGKKQLKATKIEKET